MKWRKFAAIGATTLVLGAGSSPNIEFNRTWVSWETSAKAEGGKKCLEAFRGFTTLKQEIDCDLYHDRASIKDFPNPVTANAPELKERVSLFGLAARAIAKTVHAAVAYDSITSSGDVGDGAAVSVSFSHTAVADGTIVVGQGLQDLTPADTQTNNCTFNSVEMFFNSFVTDATTDFSITTFYLPDTAAGAQTLFCQWDDATGAPPADAGVFAVNLTGADIAFPINVTANDTGSSATAAVTITPTIDGTIVVDFMLTEEANTSDITTTDHFERGEIDLNGGRNMNAGSTALVTPAGATTTSWTWTGTESWRIAAVAVKPDVCSTVGAYCTEIFTTVGTSTWTSPANLTSVDVACWAGGGAGHAVVNIGNGGGGGGANASTTGISISPSTEYSVFVGEGGAAAAGASGGNGEPSYFKVGSTYSPYACGGLGATSVTGAAGGTTACSVGGAHEAAGGTGGNGSDANDTGGGGGGAGGPNGNGSNGTNSGATGGTGGSGDAGSGGRGGTAALVGVAGSNGSGHRNGGGGGGGGDNGSPTGGSGAHGGGGGGSETIGGEGGDGMCQVSYVVPSPAAPSSSFIDNLIIWFD